MNKQQTKCLETKDKSRKLQSIKKKQCFKTFWLKHQRIRDGWRLGPES